MVLFRLTGIFILAPVLGAATVIRQVKIFLVIGLSFCIYPILLTPGRPSATFLTAVIDNQLSLWTLGAAVGLELLVGYVIGYCASLPIIGMQMGGQVIDQQMGLGIAGVFNPELQEQSGIVGEFFFLLAITIFVILGGHHAMLGVLVGSFDNVPLGGLSQFGQILDLVLGLLSTIFEMVVRIAAPLLCLVFLETVAMGFIARTVPQINILSVGFAIRILMGVVLMLAFVGIAGDIYIETLQWVLRRLTGFFAM